MTARERDALEAPAARRMLERLGYAPEDLPAPAGRPFQFSIVSPEGFAGDALDALELAERSNPDRVPVVIAAESRRGDFVLMRLEDCPAIFRR